MKDTLILCYSRTGNTQQVAERLARMITADLELIATLKRRKGLLDWLRCGYEASRKICPTIKPITADITTYQTVILATPVWASTLASPLRTALVDQGSKIKRVACVTTQGSSSCGHTIEDIEELTGQEVIASVSISQKNIKDDIYKDDLRAFAAKMQDRS